MRETIKRIAYGARQKNLIIELKMGRLEGVRGWTCVKSEIKKLVRLGMSGTLAHTCWSLPDTRPY